MSTFAMSLEELEKSIAAPQQTITEHVEAVNRSGGKPVQMPQVVVVPKPVVVTPVQQPAPKQQPSIANTPVVPPKKGGCGCWGSKA